MNKQFFSKKHFRAIFSVFITLVIWELIARINEQLSFFISRPSKIWEEGSRLVFSGILWPHLAASSEALLGGFLLALVVGVFLGIIVGYHKTLHDYLYLHVIFLGAFPLVAIVPLVIMWFGIGAASKIVIVFLMSLTPILLNTIDSVRRTNKNYLQMAQSFGADKFFLIKHIVFFEILPAIFSSMRIAIGRAVAGLIISEAFGYGIGLGFLVTSYGTSFQSTRLIVVSLILFLIVLICLGIIDQTERVVLKWK